MWNMSLVNGDITQSVPTAIWPPSIKAIIQHPSKISISQLTQSYSVILMSMSCFDTTIRRRPVSVHIVAQQ